MRHLSQKNGILLSSYAGVVFRLSCGHKVEMRPSGRYLLFARDVLPFEDQEGYIDFGLPATLQPSV
jgi:hypothetical protein